LVNLGKEKRIEGSGYVGIYTWVMPWDEVFKSEMTERQNNYNTTAKNIKKNREILSNRYRTADQEKPSR
jgi:hypothetical protein